MAPVPATCLACGAPVLRVLVAGTDGDERKAAKVDATPGGPRPRIDVTDERWVGPHERKTWPRELHSEHFWTCGKGTT